MPAGPNGRPQTNQIWKRLRPIKFIMTEKSPEYMYDAAADGDEEMVRRLLDQGVSVNDTGGNVWGLTGLMAASTQGHQAVVRLFLQRGAALEARNYGGLTALMFAANMGRDAVIRLLLDAGATVNVRRVCDGSTALMMAAEYGYPRSVRCLLAAGADPELKDDNGDAALALAELYQHDECVILLKAAKKRRKHGQHH